MSEEAKIGSAGLVMAIDGGTLMPVYKEVFWIGEVLVFPDVYTRS